MYQTILNLDKPAMEEWCRILVKGTKDGIRERVLDLLEGEELR